MPSTTNNFIPSPGPIRRHGQRRMILLLALGLFAIGIGFAASTTSTSNSVQTQFWTCSMHPQVISDKPGTCPICHMELTPLRSLDATATPAAAATAQTTVTAGKRKIKYWWDPMLNPPYISDKPGKSPMGMDLVPVYEDEKPAVVANSNAVTIDPTIVQNMGVRTATVTRGPLRQLVRAVGFLDEAEPNVRDINLRISGWIEHLDADTEGMHIKQGDPLFELYSPELQLAVGELITARKARSAQSSMADELYNAAERKLELWGLPADQVASLAKLDQPPRAIPFLSPISGHMTEKNVFTGSAVKAGDRVMRLVDHSTLWINIQIYEQQLPLVHLGQSVSAEMEAMPGQPITGKIVFIHPHIDPMTRTAMVRIAIENASFALRPGMYATVRIHSEVLNDALLVPREAVIDTGEQQLVFVTHPGGHFEPREVHMGLGGDGDVVQILDGLAAGEEVVTSGQFLLDSESRLQEAVQKFIQEKQAAAAATPTPTPAPKKQAPAAPAKMEKMNTMDGMKDMPGMDMGKM